MQFLDELTCPQCKRDFVTASELLKHFATHVIEEEFVVNPDVENEQKHQSTKKVIPDLHPIVKKVPDKKSEENVNPLTFCEARLDNLDSVRETKRFKCLYCKSFGWSTGLKRYLLSHTGKKPSNLSFAQKFKRIDKNREKPKIPDLKPIDAGFAIKPNKKRVS